MNAASTRTTSRDDAGSPELPPPPRRPDLLRRSTIKTAASSRPIEPPVPSSLAEPGRWRRDVAWRLQFQLLRGLEMLVRMAVLREWPRRAVRTTLDREQSSNNNDEPWRRQLSIGHGCSGPDLADPFIGSTTTTDDQPGAKFRITACVVGHGEIQAELVGRLLALGIQVHATAETIEDYVALRSAGAVPHRFDDMPALAPRIELLISTSFAKYIGPRVLARLPTNAVIVDLAGPLGSVDFETAQRLDLRPLWSPTSADNIDPGWEIIRAEIEAILKIRM